MSSLPLLEKPQEPRSPIQNYLWVLAAGVLAVYMVYLIVTIVGGAPSACYLESKDALGLIPCTVLEHRPLSLFLHHPFLDTVRDHEMIPEDIRETYWRCHMEAERKHYELRIECLKSRT